MSILRPDCCALAILASDGCQLSQLFYIPSCIDNRFVQTWECFRVLSLHWRKEMVFLWTMRVDTYFLTNSALLVFAVRIESSMSSVATSFVFKDNKWPEASSVDFIYSSNFWSTHRKYTKSFELLNISDADQILCCFRNISPLSPCDAETISCTVKIAYILQEHLTLSWACLHNILEPTKHILSDRMC